MPTEQEPTPNQNETETAFQQSPFTNPDGTAFDLSLSEDFKEYLASLKWGNPLHWWIMFRRRHNFGEED